MVLHIIIKIQASVEKLQPLDNKGPSSQSYGFSSSHVWMLDYKEN